MNRFTWTTELGRRALAGLSPRSGFVAALLLLGAVGSLVAACSSRTPPAPAALNCAAADAPYDFQILETYDDVPPRYGWFGFGDTTPGAVWTGQDSGGPPVVPIENGGPCGTTSLPSEPSQRALLLQAHGFQDYGNDWGTYNIGVYYPSAAPSGPQTVQPDGSQCLFPDGSVAVCPIDAQGWDGLTFWARSFDPTGSPTTKGFTLNINDSKTAINVDGTGDAGCVNYDAGVAANGSATYVAPAGGGNGPAGGGVVSAVPPADACGNSFSYILLTTGEWQLYTIPWSAFNQLARPSRALTGFDPSSFFSILIAAPKEAHSALWIDDLGFYRAKDREAGLEAGP